MKKFSITQRRKAKKYTLWFFSGLAVFSAVCFFALPPWIDAYVTKEIAAQIQRDVHVKKISVNPYALSLTLEGLEVGERKVDREGGGEAKTYSGDPGKTSFFTVDTLYLNLGVSSLFRNAIVFDEIRLTKPRINIIRFRSDLYNFSDLIVAPSGAKAAEKDAGEKGVGDKKTKAVGKEAEKNESGARRGGVRTYPRFSLRNIRLDDGKIEFDDRVRKARNTIDEIELFLPFVSSIPSLARAFGEPSLSARIDGSPIAFKGKSRLQVGAMESELTLDIKDLALPKYLAFLPVRQPARVKSGLLDGQLKLIFRQSDSTLILSGDAAFKGIDLADALGAPLASAKRLDVSIASADLLGRKIRIASVSLDSPKIGLQTDASGVLNWQALLSKPPSEKSDAPIEWSVAHTFVSDGALLWRLKQPPKRDAPHVLTVDALNIALSEIGVPFPSTVRVEAGFRFGGKSEFKLSGSVVPLPLKAELALDAVRVELAALQPLFADTLNVIVTGGHANANGLFSLWGASDSTEKGMSFTFSGDLSVEGLRASYKSNKSSSLHLGLLRLNRVDFRRNPNALSINEIVLSDFMARVVRAPSEKFGPFNIFPGNETPTAAPPERGASAASARPRPAIGIPIRIDRIGIEKGNVFFSDRFIKPNYSASLRGISGTVGNLSSDSKTRARLALRGRYDNVVPFSVDAKLNPFSSKPYLDLEAEIKGVEMTQFSGYSGKYAGHSIQKGKLSLTAQYKIEENELAAENHIFIDQLTFGRTVESPDATTLPVTLFVSLLKNRNGEITMDLPISGSLDDPHFSVGGLVFEAILNLLMKTVSSPFTLLASVFGGGEEVSALEFDYGSAAISPETKKRIETLSKIFYEHPDLKADLRGRVEPERDTVGLKKALVERKVRMAKRERTDEGEIENADAIEVNAEEYPGLLTRVYRDGDFEKPRNFIGMAKTLPVEEMQKLLMQNTQTGEEELRALADRRARAVRDALIERGVSTDRLFLLPSGIGGHRQEDSPPGSAEATSERGTAGNETTAPEDAGSVSGLSSEKAKRSRVDIVLK